MLTSEIFTKCFPRDFLTTLTIFYWFQIPASPQGQALPWKDWTCLGASQELNIQLQPLKAQLKPWEPCLSSQSGKKQKLIWELLSVRPLALKIHNELHFANVPHVSLAFIILGQRCSDLEFSHLVFGNLHKSQSGFLVSVALSFLYLLLHYISYLGTNTCLIWW